MPTFDFATVLQIVLALGLLNVWLLRTGKATAYRGGAAKNLKEEFATYGLPPFMYYLVGGLKIGCALALLAVLMLGALLMHIKVKDPISKSVPAAAMLAMTSTLALLKLGQ